MDRRKFITGLASVPVAAKVPIHPAVAASQPVAAGLIWPPRYSYRAPAMGYTIVAGALNNAYARAMAKAFEDSYQELQEGIWKELS